MEKEKEYLIKSDKQVKNKVTIDCKHMRGKTMKDKIIKCSMDIILHAGDAREECFKSLEEISNGNYSQAKENLEKAKSLILIAHRIHTEHLQDSIEQEDNEYSMLFSHAQDTLMTINTEINMTSKLIGVFEGFSNSLESLNNRLDELETKMKEG